MLGYSNKWKELMDEIVSFKENSAGLWYRGQSSSLYKLNSGLFRNQSKSDNVIEQIREYEKNSYIAFSTYGANLFNETGWSQLFLMQHHGMKTRLLDWTESFAVALYFASTNWNTDKGNARIWFLDPTKLNKTIRGYDHVIALIDDKEYERLLLDKEKFATLKTGAIFPARRNNRIIAQHGFFTIQGNSLLPLEEECNGDLIKYKVISYVDICPDMVDDVERYLSQNGIHDFSMFPDLDGLAKFLS